MTTADEYLRQVLEAETFGKNAPELKELRERRNEIKAELEEHFSDCSPSIRWAGSMAKNTMIRASYDGDVTCYFPHEDDDAGETLEQIYNNVAEVLGEKYTVTRKMSALRVKERLSSGALNDLHVDVVPGRFVDGKDGDVYLHQEAGTKERLKTNLDVHIEHIRDSGVTDAIQLMKLWNVRNGVNAKTFVLELLVVKLLEKKKGKALSAQLDHLWTTFRDEADSLSPEDPANPQGNDLKPALDQVRYMLSMVARSTLAAIENQGWEAVFGKLPESNEEENTRAALQAAAVHVKESGGGAKPWCSGA